MSRAIDLHGRPSHMASSIGPHNHPDGHVQAPVPDLIWTAMSIPTRAQNLDPHRRDGRPGEVGDRAFVLAGEAGPGRVDTPHLWGTGGTEAAVAYLNRESKD
jgi:hypothetical protein